MNHWIIDKDHQADTTKPNPSYANARGMKSPGFDEFAKLPVNFRLKDDDGEVYYEGRMAKMDFHPLDDFGMPNAGATTLEYKMRGSSADWKVM